MFSKLYNCGCGKVNKRFDLVIVSVYAGRDECGVAAPEYPMNSLEYAIYRYAARRMSEAELAAARALAAKEESGDAFAGEELWHLVRDAVSRRETESEIAAGRG